MAHTGDDLYGVGFDSHAATAAIALLAAPEVAIYFFQRNGNASGKSGESSHQTLAVRFACRP